MSGSSSGIGEETAVQFASKGAKVVLTGRNEERLATTRQKCLSVGANDDQVLVVAGDVTKEDDIARIVDSAVERFGAVHVLVNNAGAVLATRKCEETTGDDILSMMKTNTVSAFNMTKKVLPYLIETRGAVVNVSSIGGTHAFTGELAYCMSKAAMDQMTRCMALEYADRGVRVNSVNPGDIITPIQQAYGSANPHSGEDDFYQQAAKDYPMKRVGHAAEVAEAILFLASSQSSFTTGLLLPVDGGRAYCLQGAKST